jgi:hypothetical protein
VGQALSWSPREKCLRKAGIESPRSLPVEQFKSPDSAAASDRADRRRILIRFNKSSERAHRDKCKFYIK